MSQNNPIIIHKIFAKNRRGELSSPEGMKKPPLVVQVEVDFAKQKTEEDKIQFIEKTCR